MAMNDRSLSFASKKGVDVEIYQGALKYISDRISATQVKIASALTNELMHLYWDIGKVVSEKQRSEGWKSEVIAKLCADIKRQFPDTKGFSRTNVFRMRAFYQAYQDLALDEIELASLPIFCLPWRHNILLVEQLTSLDERLWYAKRVQIQNASSTLLSSWIASNLFHREGKTLTNFENNLPQNQFQAATRQFKDPYIFDVMGLKQKMEEREIEKRLIANIQEFLLELGKGFAFVGRQYPLKINGKLCYIDLLFYHIDLECYVVIELKSREFRPEHIGKLNFYLSAVDNQIKKSHHNETIGIVLCKTHDKVWAEYALRKTGAPMGIASFETELVDKLNARLQQVLPTINELELELELD